MLKLPSLPQLKPRERLIGSIAGVILLAVALDQLVLRPWLRHVHTVRQEVSRMEQVLVQHQRLLARRDRVETERMQYESYLRPAMADDLQTAALLKEIEGLASESRVKLVEIKPLGVESDERVRRYTLDVRFGGTLEEWVTFVFSLETSPSLFEIVRAGISVPEGSTNQLEGTLRVMSALVSPQAHTAPPDEDDT